MPTIIPQNQTLIRHSIVTVRMSFGDDRLMYLSDSLTPPLCIVYLSLIDFNTTFLISFSYNIDIKAIVFYL